MPFHETSPRFSFQGLLISLILLILLPGFFGDHINLLLGFSLMFVLVAALYLVANNLRHFLIGCLLVIPSVLTNSLFNIGNPEIRIIVNSVFQIAFLGYISASIFGYLFNARRVTSNVLYAAVTLYMIIGLIWALIYVLIEVSVPGSFNLGSTRDNIELMVNELLYFSFVTLTTLGYGDVTPELEVAQSFVIVQAIFGQLYLAIVIARLVGLQISSGAKSLSDAD